MDTKTEKQGRFSTIIVYLELFGLIQEVSAPVSLNFTYKESCPKPICDIDALLFHVAQHD